MSMFAAFPIPRSPRGTTSLAWTALLGCCLLVFALPGRAEEALPADAPKTILAYLAACHAQANGVVPTSEALAVAVLGECCKPGDTSALGACKVTECEARVLENYLRSHEEIGYFHDPVMHLAGQALSSPPAKYPGVYTWSQRLPSGSQLTAAIPSARVLAALAPAAFDGAFPSDAASDAACDAFRYHWFARSLIAYDRLADQVRSASDQFYARGAGKPLREWPGFALALVKYLDGTHVSPVQEHVIELTTGLALQVTIEVMKMHVRKPGAVYNRQDAERYATAVHDLLYFHVSANPLAPDDRLNLWLDSYPSKDPFPLLDKEVIAAYKDGLDHIIAAYDRKDWIDLGQRIAQAQLAMERARGIRIESNATFLPYLIAKFRAEQLTMLDKAPAALTTADLERAMTLVELGPTKFNRRDLVSAKEVDQVRTLAVEKLSTLHQHFVDGGFFALANLVQDRLAVFAPDRKDDQHHAYLHERVAKLPRLTVCLRQGQGWDGTVLGDTFLQDIAAFGSFYCPELVFTSDAAAARTVVIDQDTVNLVDPVVASSTERKIGSYLSASINMPVAVTSGSMSSSAVAAYVSGGWYAPDAVVMGHEAHAAISTRVEHYDAEMTQNFAYSEKTVRMGVMAHVVLHIAGGDAPANVPCAIDNAAFDVVREGVPALSDLGDKPYTLGDWGSFLRGARQDLALRIIDAILATRPLPTLGATSTDQEAEDLAIGLYARAYDWNTISTKVLPRLGIFLPRPSMPQMSVGYTWTLPYAPAAPVAAADLTGTYVVEGPGLRAAAIGVGEHGLVVSVAPKGWNPVGGAIYLVRAVTDEGKPLATWPALLQKFDARKGVMAFGLMGQNGGLRTATFATAPPALDQVLALGGFPDSTRTEAAILNQVRGKVVSMGTATLRDDPIAGWTAKLTDPAPGMPSVLVACDAQGAVYGLGNVDAATGMVSIAKPGILKDLARAAEGRQGGW